jgi:DNA-binding MarR family transcriptional regulator
MSGERLESIRRLRVACREPDDDALVGLLAVVTEDVLDLVQIENREELVTARSELRATHTLLTTRDPGTCEGEPGLRLGQVTSLLGLVAAAASRQPSADFQRELGNEKNRELLKLLLDGEKTSKELTKQLGVDKSAVSRRLSKLEAATLVIRQLSGRQVYSRLSLAARNALEQLYGNHPAGKDWGHFGESDIAGMFKKAS